jgi:hypothetical protein
MFKQHSDGKADDWVIVDNKNVLWTEVSLVSKSLGFDLLLLLLLH